MHICKCITATRQNKSPGLHPTTTKIMKTLFFKEWSHNISNMF